MATTRRALYGDIAPPIPPRRANPKVRHFNGATRRVNDWDGLRKDNQLWFDNADCLIYFYAQNTSQRGASAKLPYEAIKALRCKQLTSPRICWDEANLKSKASRQSFRVDRSYARLSDDSDSDLEQALHHIYVPAPPDLARQQVFAFHLTTRNLLSYAIGGPVVGEKLSIALINLWNRTVDWEIPVSSKQFVDYLEKQGYLDFTSSPEHAVACLIFAEDVQLRDLWIDSFVHCVGMYARLDLCSEFKGISSTTAGLITRASLQMDLHINRVIRAVGSFLEDDLGSSNLGLSKPARDHLDYFRSFLYSFYVNRFGYFPPQGSTPWNKRPWTSMHYDFQILYDYLADTESSPDWTKTRNLDGGLCVLQNVQSFDLRHGFPPLRHPLPLLPLSEKQAKSRNSLRKASRVPSLTPSKRTTPATKARPISLSSANNPLSSEGRVCLFVQEYQRFERKIPEGKLDAAEARKIRWLLVYGVLQMLTSVVTAPKEVRDSETPSYPLCASTVGCPPWESEGSTINNSGAESINSSEGTTIVTVTSHGHEDRISKDSVRPDCEATSAEDYFASQIGLRQPSAKSIGVRPEPPTRASSLRAASTHSSTNPLQKMVSSRPRMSLTLNRQKSRTTTEAPARKPQSPIRIDTDISIRSEMSTNVSPTGPISPLDQFDFGFRPKYRPLIPSDPLGTEQVPSLAESDSAGSSGGSVKSNCPSLLADHSATAESSSWDGGSRRDSITSDSSVSENGFPKELSPYQTCLTGDFRDVNKAFVPQPLNVRADSSSSVYSRSIYSRATYSRSPSMISAASPRLQ